MARRLAGTREHWHKAELVVSVEANQDGIEAVRPWPYCTLATKRQCDMLPRTI